MAEFGNIRVAVTTEELARQAEQFRQQVAQMESRFTAMGRTIDGTRNYWIGEEGEEHRRAYYEQRDSITAILRRLSDYRESLLRIAGIYEQAEDAVGKSAIEMATDAIH